MVTASGMRSLHWLEYSMIYSHENLGKASSGRGSLFVILHHSRPSIFPISLAPCDLASLYTVDLSDLVKSNTLFVILHHSKLSIFLILLALCDLTPLETVDLSGLVGSSSLLHYSRPSVFQTSLSLCDLPPLQTVNLSHVVFIQRPITPAVD